MNYKVKDEDRIKRTGRKPVGYSITKDKKKICDDEIKDFIIESINGDAQYYGYRNLLSEECYNESLADGLIEKLW